MLPRKTFLCGLVGASVAELFAREGAAHRGQHRQVTRLAETSAAMKVHVASGGADTRIDATA